MLPLLTATAPAVAAQASTVILVRHAEKAAPSGDPDLSQAGRERAGSLARALARFGLSGILVTQYKRTHQTADSVAQVQHLTVSRIDAGSDVPAHAAAVAGAIRRAPAGSAILVVGHSNTLAPIVAALGGPPIPDLCDGEYSTMLILELPPGLPPRLIRSAYGAADPPGSGNCQREMRQ